MLMYLHQCECKSLNEIYHKKRMDIWQLEKYLHLIIFQKEKCQNISKKLQKAKMFLPQNNNKN